MVEWGSIHVEAMPARSSLVRGGQAMTDRIKGHVKWFSHQKQYGFIMRGDGLKDVFVHRNEFRSRAEVPWLRDGDAVEFGVEQTPKGPSAVDVVVLATG